MSSVWVTKRPGKRGMRYLVRWIEPSTGKNRSKTFRRREDARDFKAKLNRDFEHNEYFAPVKISYDEWVKWHLENMANSPDVDVAPKTIAGHKEALEALARTCKPKRPIDVNPAMIREFRRKMLDNGYAVNTINKLIRTVKSALSYAVRDGYINKNKLLGPHRLCLRAEQKQPRILEVGEVIAMMNVATDLKHKATISLAFYHGLRRGEICNLCWEDIDFEQNRLFIMDRNEARTKTRKSRAVALRRETASLLQELAKDRTNDFIFTNPKTYYWECSKWFSELVRKAGIDHCTMHDLRKTCNTMMIDSGVSQEAAMQILGHSSAQVNQKFYTGMLTDRQRSLINSLPSIG